MNRRHFKAIIELLVLILAGSSSMLFAADDKPKIDLGYVTPDAVVTVVIHPKAMLGSPNLNKLVPPEAIKDVAKMFMGKEMTPAEAASAAGKQFLGIDPLEIEQVLIVGEISQSGQGSGFVLHMAGPIDQKKVFPLLTPKTSEEKFNGKTYRKGPGPDKICFFFPDDKTIVGGDEDILKKMLTNHDSPQEGKMSKVLGKFADLPDVLAIVQLTQIRPMLDMLMLAKPMPPQFEDAKKLPDLLTSVGMKANMASEMSLTFSLKANDDAAAEQVEQIVNKLVDAVKAQSAAAIAQIEASGNPIQKSMIGTQKQMNEKIFSSLKTSRKGETVTIHFGENGNP
jgi:hypothetical protein